MTDTKETSKFLLSGNEAVALAAEHAGVALGTGYPGTPSTEILENFSANGGRAQWAPNEKVALEVGLGAAYAGARALVTMKHVGVNVAADPLFTAAYTGVSGGLILISADDPGMAFSQNEQDNRNYAKAAGIPMFEPSDSQEAYAFTLEAFELSERWHLPIMLRLTTRVCHSKTVVQSNGNAKPAEAVSFERDIPGRVMIPAYARPAHKRLRERLAEIETWNENSGLNRRIGDSTKLGIVASGIAAMHAYEAAPGASVLKLGVTYPLPMGLIRDFVKSVDRCVVVEEGDPYLTEAIRAEGLAVESKADLYRFGELSVSRIRRLLAQDTTPEAPPPKGKPPPALQGLPAPQRLHPSLQTRLHRLRRHRLLHIGGPAAVSGHGHLRLHGCQHRRRLGSTACPARGAGAESRQRHRRQHLCSQWNHRLGGDGLQHAQNRPCRADSR